MTIECSPVFSTTSASAPSADLWRSKSLDNRVATMVDIHLHPTHGSRYWLSRQKTLGFDIRDRVRTFQDLSCLGITNTVTLAKYSVWDFLPQAMHCHRTGCVVGESGGTTGSPTAGVYIPTDYQAAFVSPFLHAVELTGFPRNTEWLWIGPSGPHIIGKVVRELARQTECPDPWSVDFDPRWVKRLVAGSFAAKRYLKHVVGQAQAVLDRESPEVLFTTPPILDVLANAMSDRQRDQIRGVHYGGMAITAEQINHFRALFANAVHLSGYGNTLCGVALELEDRQRQSVDYFPYGGRLVYQVVRMHEDNLAWTSLSPGEKGQVMFHRLDESSFLPNVLERDEATLVPSISEYNEAGWTLPGLRNPGPPEQRAKHLKIGLY